MAIKRIQREVSNAMSTWRHVAESLFASRNGLADESAESNLSDSRNERHSGITHFDVLKCSNQIVTALAQLVTPQETQCPQKRLL